jgi:large subunit ribosomal protein L15
MPLKRRVPKRGFTNIFRVQWAVVNLRDLNRLEGIQEITPGVLIEKGLVRRGSSLVKVLAEGNVTRPLSVQAHRFSASAAAKIQAAGGRAEVLDGA